MSADFRALHGLHNFCLTHFEYVADILNFGETDHWMSPDEIRKQLAGAGHVVGDCDDFASLAVMLARQQGLPARFVLCNDETGGCHLVAEVDGWIIDNRQQDVVRQDDLDYTWLAISGYSPGDPWHSIAA